MTHPPLIKQWNLYPAIDLCDGVCVRLSQGDFSRREDYNSDPVDQAGQFVEQGARCLHMVDLDGARLGSMKNRQIIESVVRAYPQLYIQVGGGIREQATIDQYLQMGIGAVIIGTECLLNPDWVQKMGQEYPQRIKLGLDARAGQLAVSGWTEQSTATALEIAKLFSFPEIAGIIYTDIDKDGMLSGANVEATAALATQQDIPVIASGGVGRMNDIEKIYAHRQDNISGVIVGKALYAGAIDFRQAMRDFGGEAAQQEGTA